MKPRWVLTSIAVVAGCVSYGYFSVSNRVQASEAASDFLTWGPTASEIHSAMASLPAATAGKGALEKRQKQFSRLFESRYRRHEPDYLAVALRFEPNNRLRLKVPARMEPFALDRLAMATWLETRDNFGHPFSIDIYETYIGAPAIKVSELRPAPGDPSRFIVNHFDPQEHHTATLSPGGHRLALP